MGLKRSSLLVLFPAILLLACQPAEKEPQISGNLYVRYLQDGQQLKAEASFFKGDSVRQPISILGGVSFQGSGMESRNLQELVIRYKYENTADYPGQFTFQAQDDSGTPYRFQLEMLPVSDFILPDTLDPSTGCTLKLEPAPVSPEESLALLFTDSTGKTSLIEVPAPLSQTISLRSDQLENLEPGLQQVYLVKKRHTSIQQGPFRLNGDVEYYTGIAEVFVFNPQNSSKKNQ